MVIQQKWYEVYGQAEGFEPGARSGTGLSLRTKQTRPGLAEAHGWPGGPPRRRARHAAVLDAGGAAAHGRHRHRALVAPDQQGRGREGLSVDWP